MAPRVSVSPKKASAIPAKEEKATGTGGDIRNFFAGGSQSKPAAQTSSKKGQGAGTGRQPILIDDSDDEDVKPVINAKQKTTTSKHFPKAESSHPVSVPSSSSASPAPAPKRKTAITAKKEEGGDDDEPVVKRRKVAVAAPAARKPKINYLEESDSEPETEEEVEVPKAKSVSTAKKSSNTITRVEIAESDSPSSEEEDTKPKAKKKASAATPAAAAKAKTTPAKKPPAASTSSSVKKEKEKEKEKPKVEEPEQEVKPKPKWNPAMRNNAAQPRNPGSKEIPEGAPDCLAGLIFVFTGELEALGRDEAIELAKRYSAKVTGAPSGKTSYVVMGQNAGASKQAMVDKHKLKTLTEDQFLQLIVDRSRAGGGGMEMDEKALKAREKEEQKIKENARIMEQKEREEEQLRKRKEKAMEGTGVATKKITPISSQLWTTKYAPTNLKEICGNKAPVERLGEWLREWDNNYKSGFKKPGKNGMGIYRAVLISGPPGIGKTTSAHLMAKAAGYSPLELNASDARSKKLVENSTNIDNASLDGFFQGTGVQSTAAAGVTITSKTCLIMDEVDGMSAGDRGGVGALNTLIKKTRIPLILICNDRTLQKMKPLQSTTYNMAFRRPSATEVRSRILSILFKEKMKIPANVVDELVSGANSDIRQVLNMLSTFKLGKSEMDFDEGKALLKINEKNTILTPFTIIDKLTGPYAFSRTSRETLGDRMELYFHDFSFVPLFMQEHYLKTNPARVGNESGPMAQLKSLDHVSKASDWISDGDLVDRLIHGSEQHWSLLPFHAVTSTVAPAWHVYGPSRSGQGGWGGPSFPQWLGQNSKQGKLQRQLTDIQIRMRLRVSGSKQEIRETYMPMLASKIVTPLVKNGQESVQEVIETMDDYYLGKEDWDAFVELGVDGMKDEIILKKIPTAVKTAFTRQYNKADHPIAFHKGDLFAQAKKKIADQGPAPDNDEVFEDDEPVPDDDESDKEKDGDGGTDDGGDAAALGKDKLIKAVKPKAKGKAKASTKK